MNKKTALKEIKDTLFQLQDVKYGDFQSKLIPDKERDYFIGVRTPELRKYAKELVKRSTDVEGKKQLEYFLSDMPHKYFDENQLHAFIISLGRDFEETVNAVEAFLAYVNNWATCDQMSPKIFKKHRKELLPYIKRWLKSKETYTVRFAIGMLMEHFLDEYFDLKYPEMVAKVESDEYYVKMMIAWYFATALAKQYDAILPFILDQRLDKWTHNKTIQKSIESYRITPSQKEELRQLKI